MRRKVFYHAKAMWNVSVTAAFGFFFQPYLCVCVRERLAAYCFLCLLCLYYIMFPACVCIMSSSNMQSEHSKAMWYVSVTAAFGFFFANLICVCAYVSCLQHIVCCVCCVRII